jgi:hypothetical protein
MSRRPWSDGDVLAIAWYAATSFVPVWSQLAEHDPRLDRGQLTDLLAEVSERGFEAGPDIPPGLDTGGRIESELDRLVELVNAVREAVAVTFTEPGALGERIWATCEQPRVHFSLGTAALAGPGQVELLQLGDLPRASRDWVQRGTVARYRNLRVLSLSHADLGPRAVGIRLDDLMMLQSLDLSQNRFEAMPPDTLGCGALEELYLDQNPVHDVSPLHDPAVLPRLRYLSVMQTDLTDASVCRLTESRPGLGLGI